MKTRLTLFVAVLAASVLCSCSLKEQLTSYSEQKNYYRNAKEIQTGLNACYSPIRSIYANVSFWQMTECDTDLMYLNVSNQYNAICNITLDTPWYPACHRVTAHPGRAGVMLQIALYWLLTFRYIRSVSHSVICQKLTFA